MRCGPISVVRFRDLAARNCLLGVDKVGGHLLKISDFGMSREGTQYVMQNVKTIPIKWTAIEVLRGKPWTHKADVWSFGVLMWEIYTDGAVPYSAVENCQTFVSTGINIYVIIYYC